MIYVNRQFLKDGPKKGCCVRAYAHLKKGPCIIVLTIWASDSGNNGARAAPCILLPHLSALRPRVCFLSSRWFFSLRERTSRLAACIMRYYSGRAQQQISDSTPMISSRMTQTWQHLPPCCAARHAFSIPKEPPNKTLPLLKNVLSGKLKSAYFCKHTKLNSKILILPHLHKNFLSGR